MKLRCGSDGSEYIELNERQTKTRTGDNIRDVRKVTPKIFSVDGNRDPVKLYKLYSEKRPAAYNGDDTPFYLAPRTIPLLNQDTDIWFMKQRIGTRKLGALLKTMATKAGLEVNKKLTNHSARKHLVQKLRDSNIPPTDIMQITGHKNVQSIINYSSISEETHKNCSNILSGSKSISSCPSQLPPVSRSESRSESVPVCKIPLHSPVEATLSSPLQASISEESVRQSQRAPLALPVSVNSGFQHPTHPSSSNQTSQLQSMFFGATVNISNFNVYTNQ